MKGVNYMYTIDVCKTIDNFYNRADTYKNAIEKCNSISHMTHILTGYERLVMEWCYVAKILFKIPDIKVHIKVLACNQVLFNINEIAKHKSQELFS